MFEKHLKLFLKNETVSQVYRYFSVAVICTLLDFALLFILTNYLGINYLISSIISFMSGTILNYLLCIQWIFKIRVIKDSRLEFIYYVIITGIGLGINTGIIWCFTELFGLYYMFSRLISLFFTFSWNFGARKYLLHTVR